MDQQLKPHRSLQEQVEILRSRGLQIDDVASAEQLLFNVNYYRITGYLHAFKIKGTDQYMPGTTLAKIKSLYDFDRKFTRILMYALEDIEETLKTRISYTLTSTFPDDSLIYLNSEIYRRYDEYARFVAHFNREVQNNRNLPFIKHHIEKYDGKLPCWVAVEVMTMGNLHGIYKNLLAPLQKKIAKTYNTGPNQLSSWIQNLTFTRNHLAHYMRIYDFNFGRTPVQCNRHHQYKKASGYIFDQIYIMSFLHSSPEEWNNYILPEMGKLLNEYSKDVQLDHLGFPENWTDILRIDSSNNK